MLDQLEERANAAANFLPRGKHGEHRALTDILDRAQTKSDAVVAAPGEGQLALVDVGQQGNRNAQVAAFRRVERDLFQQSAIRS